MPVEMNTNVAYSAVYFVKIYTLKYLFKNIYIFYCK